MSVTSRFRREQWTQLYNETKQKGLLNESGEVVKKLLVILN